jgi:hypothetical protein
MKVLTSQNHRGNRCLKKLKHRLNFPSFLVSSSLSFSSGEDQTQGLCTRTSNFATHFMWKHSFEWH